MIRSLLKSIAHPSEVKAMVSLGWNGKLTYGPSSADIWAEEEDPRRFSYNALNRVSRSFAAVIRQLPEDLEDAICVFYLVLRGLDSIEDDMTIRLDEKQLKLVSFHLRLKDGSDHAGIGDTPDYRTLMANFHKVSAFYNLLPKKYRSVIKEICQLMGEGMTDFTVREVITMADYDEYCHHVAGLVGWGLTKMFAVSGHEDASLGQHLDMANSMGLFLQKTNIARDYHEDLQQGRLFWPSAIWEKHASHIGHFADDPTDPDHLSALNAMVTDALRHLPDCIRYMGMLHNSEVFRFCAIPQAMAIATLAKIYANPDVFVRNVKIRKGLAAKIMLEVCDAESLWDIMEQQFNVLEDKMDKVPQPDRQARQHLQDARMEISIAHSHGADRSELYKKVS